MTKPVQPAVAPEIGRDEQPDERDNEIVIELDRENQYGRTQPRANEPQGNHLRYTELIHSSPAGSTSSVKRRKIYSQFALHDTSFHGSSFVFFFYE